jgi:hypothetical protein
MDLRFKGNCHTVCGHRMAHNICRHLSVYRNLATPVCLQLQLLVVDPFAAAAAAFYLLCAKMLI